MFTEVDANEGSCWNYFDGAFTSLCGFVCLRLPLPTAQVLLADGPMTTIKCASQNNEEQKEEGIQYERPASAVRNRL
jgi:hypothetical protein